MAKGDIFYSSASTYGISHGRVGIFSRTNYITEARDSDHPSGNFLVAGRRYCATIEKMFVNIPISDDINTLNYSELVYKAFKRSVNVDLDGDGGLGVYPSDIKDSDKTITYQTIR